MPKQQIPGLLFWSKVYPATKREGTVKLLIFETQEDMLSYAVSTGFKSRGKKRDSRLEGLTMYMQKGGTDKVFKHRGYVAQILMYLEATTALVISHEATHAAAAWLMYQGKTSRMLNRKRWTGSFDEALATATGNLTQDIADAIFKYVESLEEEPEQKYLDR